MIAVAPRDLLLLVGITLIWGLNLIVSKVGVSEFPPITFTVMRFAVVGILLMPFLKFRAGQMSALVVAGVLSSGLQFALNFSGISLADNVSSLAIVSQLGVPFTTLLGVALLGEVVRWRRWTGIVLSFAGVLVIGLDSDLVRHWRAIVLVASSAFVASLGLIAVKKLQGFKPLELQSWFAWVSLPVLVPLAIGLERPTVETFTHASLNAWGALAFTAIASSIVAHTCYYHLVQRYPVTSVAPLTVLSPIFSLIFGVLLLNEHLSGRMLLGTGLTLAGVVIITLRERRIVDTGS